MIIAAFPLTLFSSAKASKAGADSALATAARAVLLLGSLLFIANLLGWIPTPS